MEIIDANGSPEEVVQAALGIVRDRYTEKLTLKPVAPRQSPITLALTGTHCAGKKTLGRLLAGFLGWRFEPELGDILGEKTSLWLTATKVVMEEAAVIMKNGSIACIEKSAKEIPPAPSRAVL